MKKYIWLIIFILIFSASCKKEGRIDVSVINSERELQKYLTYGWNTWNNSNLLSHVLLPEGLELKISFRVNYRIGYPYYLNESYIASPKHNFPAEVTPIAHTYDGQYTELRIKWQGMTALVQSASHHDDLLILITPEEVPEYPHIMLLEAGMLYNRDGRVEKNGSYLQADMGTRTHSIGSTRKDTIVLLPINNPYLAFNSTEQTGFFTGEIRSLEYIRNFIQRRKNEFYEKNNQYGDLSEAYYALKTLLSWNLIYDQFNNRAITPVSRVWNENWGGWVLFDWDTYFTAAMYAVDNKFHAYANAIAITNEITPEGFIPNYSASLANEKSYDRSQPPVGSIICKLIYDKYPEEWFLLTVYDKLLTWNKWWPENRDNQGYLSWGSNPHPKGDKANTKEAAQLESGLDNSPLFDEAVYNEETNMLELASVGLMSMYIADCKALADIAEILGKDDDQKELMDRAEKYSTSLSRLWDEETGIYRDKDLSTNEFSKHLAPTNFYPLLAEVPDQEKAERMINEHFMNPDEFFGEFMIASIAKNDPAYTDNSYWRGRIWAPMNFLVYLGLRNYDLPEARSVLAEKSKNLLYKEWITNRRVYENYNAETGQGDDVNSSDSFYSWGGLLALIALMEAETGSDQDK